MKTNRKKASILSKGIKYLLDLLRKSEGKMVEFTMRAQHREKMLDFVAKGDALPRLIISSIFNFRRMLVMGRKNIPDHQPCLYVPNHISYWDPIGLVSLLTPLLGLVRIYSITSEEVYIPLAFMGYLREWLGMIPTPPSKFFLKEIKKIDDDKLANIENKDPDRRLKPILKAAQALEKGYSVIIFPEGDVNHPEEKIRGNLKAGKDPVANLIRFHVGAIRIIQEVLKDTGRVIPIVPVGIDMDIGPNEIDAVIFFLSWWKKLKFVFGNPICFDKARIEKASSKESCQGMADELGEAVSDLLKNRPYNPEDQHAEHYSISPGKKKRKKVR